MTHQELEVAAYYLYLKRLNLGLTEDYGYTAERNWLDAEAGMESVEQLQDAWVMFDTVAGYDASFKRLFKQHPQKQLDRWNDWAKTETGVERWAALPVKIDAQMQVIKEASASLHTYEFSTTQES